MNKLYTYIDKNVQGQAERYKPYLKNKNAAVFFIGEDYDVSQLKIEINHIVAKGYTLYCVLFGNPVFDSGISMQMGLAKRIQDSPDAPNELGKLLEEKKKGHLGLYIAIAAIVVLAIVLILILGPKKEEPVAADNIHLDEVYLEAFINAGADSIVVDGGISKEEMLLVEELDLSGKGIESLEPLLYATNLKALNLSNNNIKDVTPLAALAKLETLDLSGNPVENFGILDYLPNLTTLIK